MIAQFGLIQSKNDPCVFVRQGNGRSILGVGINVDDGIILADNECEIDQLLEHLKQAFNRKIHGGDPFPVSSPIDHNRSLCSLSNSSGVKFPYRSAVESLNYLAVTTRPDVSFAVGVARRHLESPCAADVKGAKRFLSYVKGTAEILVIFPGGKIDLIGYSDSDYAGDTIVRRSTSGGVFFVAGAPVWHSRRQRYASTSTAEAEFISAAEAANSTANIVYRQAECIETD